MPVNVVHGAPPASSKPKESAAVNAPKRITKKTQDRADALNGVVGLIQFGLTAAQLNNDAAAIGLFFPPVSLETAKLAEDNESVANVLDSLAIIGPYAALLTAATPLVAQLLVNHDIIKVPPNNQLGVLSKKEIEAQLEMAAIAQEMEILEQTKAMQDRVNAMRAERDQMRAEVIGATDDTA